MMEKRWMALYVRVYSEWLNSEARLEELDSELREARRVGADDARALHGLTHLAKNGVEDFNDCDQPRCVHARQLIPGGDWKREEAGDD